MVDDRRRVHVDVQVNDSALDRLNQKLRKAKQLAGSVGQIARFGARLKQSTERTLGPLERMNAKLERAQSIVRGLNTDVRRLAEGMNRLGSRARSAAGDVAALTKSHRAAAQQAARHADALTRVARAQDRVTRSTRGGGNTGGAQRGGSNPFAAVTAQAQQAAKATNAATQALRRYTTAANAAARAAARLQGVESRPPRVTGQNRATSRTANSTAQSAQSARVATAALTAMERAAIRAGAAVRALGGLQITAPNLSGALQGVNSYTAAIERATRAWRELAAAARLASQPARPVVPQNAKPPAAVIPPKPQATAPPQAPTPRPSAPAPVRPGTPRPTPETTRPQAPPQTGAQIATPIAAQAQAAMAAMATAAAGLSGALAGLSADVAAARSNLTTAPHERTAGQALTGAAAALQAAAAALMGASGGIRSGSAQSAAALANAARRSGGYASGTAQRDDARVRGVAPFIGFRQDEMLRRLGIAAGGGRVRNFAQEIQHQIEQLRGVRTGSRGQVDRVLEGMRASGLPQPEISRIVQQVTGARYQDARGREGAEESVRAWRHRMKSAEIAAQRQQRRLSLAERRSPEGRGPVTSRRGWRGARRDPGSNVSAFGVGGFGRVWRGITDSIAQRFGRSRPAPEWRITPEARDAWTAARARMQAEQQARAREHQRATTQEGAAARRNWQRQLQQTRRDRASRPSVFGGQNWSQRWNAALERAHTQAVASIGRARAGAPYDTAPIGAGIPPRRAARPQQGIGAAQLGNIGGLIGALRMASAALNNNSSAMARLTARLGALAALQARRGTTPPTNEKPAHGLDKARQTRQRNRDLTGGMLRHAGTAHGLGILTAIERMRARDQRTIARDIASATGNRRKREGITDANALAKLKAYHAARTTNPNATLSAFGAGGLGAVWAGIRRDITRAFGGITTERQGRRFTRDGMGWRERVIRESGERVRPGDMLGIRRRDGMFPRTEPGNLERQRLLRANGPLERSALGGGARETVLERARRYDQAGVRPFSGGRGGGGFFGFGGAAAAGGGLAGFMSRSRTGLGLRQMLGFAGIGSALGAIVGGIREYARTQMAEIRAGVVTSGSQADKSALGNLIRQLASNSQFSAAQLFDASRFMGMAGMNARQQIQALPTIERLSVATGVPLAKAADQITNIASTIGGMANISRIADQLASVASNSNTSIPQLAEAVKYGVGTGKGLGFDTRQMFSALGLAGNVGMQGSLGGTGLRTFLSRLVTMDKKSMGALTGAGSQLFDGKGKLKTRDLGAIFNDLLRVSLKDKDVIAKAFRQRAGTFANGILEQLRSDPTVLGRMQLAQYRSPGILAQQADAARQGLQGAWNRLVSAAQSLAVSVGESGVGKALTAFTNGLATATGGLSRWIDRISGNVKPTTEKQSRDRVTELDRQRAELQRRIAAARAGQTPGVDIGILERSLREKNAERARLLKARPELRRTETETKLRGLDEGIRAALSRGDLETYKRLYTERRGVKQALAGTRLESGDDVMRGLKDQLRNTKDAIAWHRAQFGAVPKELEKRYKDLERDIRNQATTLALVRKQAAAAPFRLGAKGDDVRKLQQELIRRGAKIKADGTFGPSTLEAFRNDQIRTGRFIPLPGERGVKSDETRFGMGERSARVSALQEYLRSKGFTIGDPSGAYGPGTRSAHGAQAAYDRLLRHSAPYFGADGKWKPGQTTGDMAARMAKTVTVSGQTVIVTGQAASQVGGYDAALARLQKLKKQAEEQGNGSAAKLYQRMIEQFTEKREQVARDKGKPVKPSAPEKPSAPKPKPPVETPPKSGNSIIEWFRELLGAKPAQASTFEHKRLTDMLADAAQRARGVNPMPGQQDRATNAGADGGRIAGNLDIGAAIAKAAESMRGSVDRMSGMIDRARGGAQGEPIGKPTAPPPNIDFIPATAAANEMAAALMGVQAQIVAMSAAAASAATGLSAVGAAATAAAGGLQHAASVAANFRMPAPGNPHGISRPGPAGGSGPSAHRG